MDSCLPYKTAMVSLNTSCLNYTGNWNPFGKTNDCFLGKIVKTSKSQNCPKGEKIHVKFPKIIMKGDKKWKSPSRDVYGPEKVFRGCEPRNVEKRISLDEVSIVSEDRLNRGHLAPGRGRPAPRSPRPWARTTRAEITSPLGEDDPRRSHLAHGRGRPAPRSPRPWARTTRAEVTSPKGEDDLQRGHLTHGRGPTSHHETVHPRLSSRNTILGPLDAIPMSRLA
ncbi:hypothetical protein DY000_02058728 [Brassica cretica]|uniref:Uncharacterized protein n=1 Tax=Brassica cretica TaxID=69181 RepID=A0ABQ7AZE5_BRACR|nr:hypothetical protein DY000_02058728 [Brassica cretica]